MQQAGGIDGDAPLVVPLTEAEQILLTADDARRIATDAFNLANDQPKQSRYESRRKRSKRKKPHYIGAKREIVRGCRENRAIRS